MATELIEGQLLVKKGKKDKIIYEVQFLDKKGLSKKMPIHPAEMYFKKEDALNNVNIVIERENGQIKKVTIPGKEECSPSEQKIAPVSNKIQRFQPNRTTSYYNSYSNTNSFATATNFNSIPPATAPYNFIAQSCVLPAPTLQDNEEYYSGRLICTLETLTPLLVSGVQDKKQELQASMQKSFCKINNCPVIPGTSLKGLLRSCVETLTCSTIKPINERRIFWRNFDDEKYKEIHQMGQEPNPQKAGYLIRRGADFEIIPVDYTIVLRSTPQRPPKKRVITGAISSKKHDYDFDPFPSGKKGFVVPDNILDDFLLQMTPAQEKFVKENYGINGSSGIRNMKAQDYLPVFYLPAHAGQGIDFFGLARYFRYPKQYTPAQLRDNTTGTLPEGTQDFAEQLFGFADKDRHQRGRVACSAVIFPAQTKELQIPEVVLGQPHSVCFAHYLVQDKTQLRAMKKQNRRWDVNSMSSYNTLGKIRGRKFYWHRDKEVVPPPNSNRKVQNTLVPLVSGVQSEFTVYLERVSLVELGCILEALFLPEGHAHKLGMGKSLGLGSIVIKLQTSDLCSTKELYTNLEQRCLQFFALQTHKALTDQTQLLQKAREAFRNWLLQALKQKGINADKYENLPHIADFLHLTDYAHKPANEKTRNMTLQDFRNLRVLAEAKNIH